MRCHCCQETVQVGGFQNLFGVVRQKWKKSPSVSSSQHCPSVVEQHTCCIDIMPSKIPLAPRRGRVTTPAAQAQPTNSSGNGTPDAATPSKVTPNSTPRLSMIPRINFNSGAKAKIDSGLVRKKPVQKHVTIDPVVVEDLVERVEPRTSPDLDTDVSSPIHRGVGNANPSSRIPSISSKTTDPQMRRGSSKSPQRPQHGTPVGILKVESGSVPVRRSKNEILEMQLEKEFRALEAERKSVASLRSSQASKSIPDANDTTRVVLKSSDIGINVLMSPVNLEDSLSKTPFEDRQVPIDLASGGRPIRVTTAKDTLPGTPGSEDVNHQVQIHSGTDVFHGTAILDQLIPPVEDVNQNYEWPSLPAVHGVSIQEITAPKILHETVSDPKLYDDPSVQLELNGRTSISEEEQPPYVVESIAEMSEVVAPPPEPTASVEKPICEYQLNKSSTKTFRISKKTPTSSVKEITSCRSIKKSFSKILLEATSKTNQENVELLQKEITSFLDVQAARDAEKKDLNGNKEQEDEEYQAPEQEDQIHTEGEEEEEQQQKNDICKEEISESSELDQEDEEERNAIVEELLQLESLDNNLSMSAKNLRDELVYLRTGVNEMKLWGSITMYLTSGVVIAVMAMENFRGFMETSFAPPELPTAVGFWASMYRTVFGAEVV